MYRESFLQRLAQLELQITNDSTYDIYTRSVLADLVEYVEGGSFSHSYNTHFIVKNFRLSIKDMTDRWNNKEGIDNQKSEAAFRSQISTVSKCLYTIFPYFPNAFINENKEQLRCIETMINTLSNYQENINDYFGDEITTYITGEASRKYETEELKTTIESLRPLLKRNIWEKLDNLDEDKVKYIFWVLKQPLTSNRRRETNKQKIEILNHLSEKEHTSYLDVYEVLNQIAGDSKYYSTTSDSERVRKLRSMLSVLTTQAGFINWIEKNNISSADIFDAFSIKK